MNIFRTTPQSFFLFDDSAAGNGGATPTPIPASSSAPAATPSGGAPSSPSGGAAPGSDTPAAPAQISDPFSGLDGTDWSDLDEVILPDAPSTVEGAPVVPAAPAAAPKAPAASPAPAATPPTPPVAAAVPPGPTPTPASSRAALDEAVDGFKTNSKELSAWAGDNLFKLSDEDAAALVTNAETVIPRLMGQVYTQALAAAGNLIRNFTPGLIEQAIEQQHTSRTRATEAVSEFYKANSDLNEKDHGALVTQWAKAFRSANPKATRAEAIDYVARAVRIQAGLPMPGQHAAPVAARPQPFSPARPGGRPPTPTTEADPYAGLGMEFDE